MSLTIDLTIGGIAPVHVRQRLRRSVMVFAPAGRGHVMMFADALGHYAKLKGPAKQRSARPVT
jgi:hypothetical protein